MEKIVVATAEPVAAPKKLRINLNTYPDIIDPQKSSFVNEIAHLKLMYEGLTKLDKDLKTVPGAAEKWEYNADATELTFTLPPGPEVQRRQPAERGPLSPTRSSATSTPRPPVSTPRSPTRSRARPNGAAAATMRRTAKRP